MSVTAEVSATAVTSSSATTFGSAALALSPCFAGRFVSSTSSFMPSVRPWDASALEIGDAFGDVLHLEHSAQTGIVGASDQRGVFSRWVGAAPGAGMAAMAGSGAASIACSAVADETAGVVAGAASGLAALAI